MQENIKMISLRSLFRRIGKGIFVNIIEEDLFDKSIPIERARKLFKKYVHYVEIENHSFCNRVCWFCPNSFIDRRSNNVLMTDAVFTKIIENLKEIDYSRTLSWSGYSELFADSSSLERIDIARKQLPRASLFVYTNGDYLTSTIFDFLIDRRVFLHVDLYLPEGKEHDEESAAHAIDKFKRRTGVDVVKRKSLRADHVLVKNGKEIFSRLLVARYTPESITTRGGLMDIPKRINYLRSAICLKPLHHLVVSYHGRAMLCCNTHSDSPEHQEAVIGNLSVPGYDLFDYFRDLSSARSHLLGPGRKGGVCSTCDDVDDGPSGILARHSSFANMLRAVPGINSAVTYLYGRRYTNPKRFLD